MSPTTQAKISEPPLPGLVQIWMIISLVACFAAVLLPDFVWADNISQYVAYAALTPLTLFGLGMRQQIMQMLLALHGRVVSGILSLMLATCFAYVAFGYCPTVIAANMYTRIAGQTLQTSGAITELVAHERRNGYSYFAVAPAVALMYRGHATVLISEVEYDHSHPGDTLTLTLRRSAIGTVLIDHRIAHAADPAKQGPAPEHP